MSEASSTRSGGNLFGCLGWALLLYLGGCATGVRQPEQTTDFEPQVPGTVGAEPALAAEPTPEELVARRIAELACVRITIAATGDIMLGTDFPEDHRPDDDALSFLTDVEPAFTSADIAFGNLEGVLMDGGEPEKECTDPDACYLFRSPARYASRLADAGFNVMSLANNHARDFGEDGRTATMVALEAVGVRHSGRVGDIATWVEGEIKVAVIAFAPFKNSNSMLDLDEAKQQVQILSDANDLVIVSFHGGAEGKDASRVPFTTEYYYGEDRGDVVQFAHGMIEAGADLIIGHGPHVPRAMEIYHDRLIAYSLGNFATYYGISVNEAKGYAPILFAMLDGNGQFVSGEIVSAIQIRPDGPKLDDQHRAYERIWELTEQDFSGGGIKFHRGGGFLPIVEKENLCRPSPANEPT